MLLNKLQGIIPANTLKLVSKISNIMFDKSSGIQYPEAWVLYSQNIVEEFIIREILTDIYKLKFFQRYQANSFIFSDIVDKFKESGYVPLTRNFNTNTIIVGTIPEFSHLPIPQIGTCLYNVKPLTLYDYIILYQNYYEQLPKFVVEISAKDAYDLIVNEALTINAADITISDRANNPVVYYNVNKRKVKSKRTFPKNIVSSLVVFLSSQANSTIYLTNNKPIYFTVNIDATHRGRTVINKTYNGHSITQRVLSNSLLSETYNTLNIPKDVQQFLYRYFVNQHPGLKIIAGPTYSGKNTTLITTLFEIYKNNDCKIVSVENPVEILTDFIEQIDVQTEEEFILSVHSLIRQNPDIAYITEVTNVTALETIKLANTSKAVLTSVHCNTVADIPLRLQQLSNMPMDEILENIDSLMHQELIPKKCPKCNDDGCIDCYKAGIIPVFTYLHIDNTVKRKLIGADTATIIATLDELTQGKNQLKGLLDKGIISQKTYDRRK